MGTWTHPSGCAPHVLGLWLRSKVVTVLTLVRQGISDTVRCSHENIWKLVPKRFACLQTIFRNACDLGIALLLCVAQFFFFFLFFSLSIQQQKQTFVLYLRGLVLQLGCLCVPRAKISQKSPLYTIQNRYQVPLFVLSL